MDNYIHKLNASLPKLDKRTTKYENEMFLNLVFKLKVYFSSKTSISLCLSALLMLKFLA
jgi:hypothetical protein